MELRPIRTEIDYQEALREIELLFNAAPNTPEYDQLDVLSTLVEAYEKKHIPIAIPHPVLGQKLTVYHSSGAYSSFSNSHLIQIY